MLGFWTSLFSSYYDQSIAIPVIPTVFRHKTPRRTRTRHEISPRLDEIRFVRNRAFHHESLWHWINLPVKHEQIVETIGWINPRCQALVLAVDRFETVHAQGWEHFRHELEFLLLEEEEARNT